MCIDDKLNNINRKLLLVLGFDLPKKAERIIDSIIIDIENIRGRLEKNAGYCPRCDTFNVKHNKCTECGLIIKT